MGFFKKVGDFLGHVIDIRVDRWFNVQGHKENVSYITRSIKKLWTPTSTIDPTLKPGSFEAMVQNNALSPEWLAQQSHQYKKLAQLFVGLAVLLFIYSLILLYLANWMGLCISVALVSYALALAFRFHFFHFQIIKRRLDCSPKEWMNFVMNNDTQSDKGIADDL